jgi:hypothetical protein
MTVPRLKESLLLMRRFQSDLASFESELQGLWSLKQYSGYEWMAGPTPNTAIHELGTQIIQTLGPLRDTIGKNIDGVTSLLARYGVPTIWKVYPPPALGGVIKTYNPFHAFIDLELEKDARPTLLQIQDLVSKAIWRAEKEIEELTLNPPTAASKLSVVPRYVGKGLSWLFPTEKQRGVLGWVILAGLIAAILRYLFGVHIESIGRILTKLYK